MLSFYVPDLRKQGFMCGATLVSGGYTDIKSFRDNSVPPLRLVSLRCSYEGCPRSCQLQTGRASPY
jgi:hypothetical protein